jgi:hypothetical protein
MSSSSSSSSCMRLRVVLFLAQRRAIRLTIFHIHQASMPQRHRIKRGVRQVQMTPIVSFTPAAVSLIARVRVSTRTRIRNHDGDALRAGVDASLRLWKSAPFASLNRTRTASSNHRDRIESSKPRIFTRTAQGPRIESSNPRWRPFTHITSKH